MIKPQFSVSWIRTKKNAKTATLPIVEPIPTEYLDAAKDVLNTTVETTKAAAEELGVKAIIGGVIIGASIVVLHTGGQILVNFLNRPSTD